VLARLTWFGAVTATGSRKIDRGRFLGGALKTKNPLDERASREAADGTRTHDLLHGNRLRFPHERLVLRFSAESDYQGLPAIRALLVPQWSPAGPPSEAVSNIAPWYQAPRASLSGPITPQ
jgi:hypothetical protein